MIDISSITIDNYYEFSDKINELKRSEQFQELESALIRIIEICEKESHAKGDSVAPAYYFELSKLYKKLKQSDKEISILKRYLIQIKAGGKTPREIYAKYLKLNIGKVESEMQDDIYKDYLSNIISMKRKTISSTCPACNKEALYIQPIGAHTNEYIQMFRSCCPYCCSETLVFESQ